ncbi:hypothetical protein BJ508DRAFT_410640 [Ascobolus immersus RN42]|uniref:F-box domain-containing protein n=1 Tax=Ascobolus immersus RN42 TaxID=1160509 RepID=A0A3N4IZI6_ASCIM|nr:hypothetical protein BJ508DRAFT_410640 [Ascobolus immersus RN42]
MAKISQPDPLLPSSSHLHRLSTKLRRAWHRKTADVEVPTSIRSLLLTTVPIELRLEIYTHCTAFTLFILCRTCSTFYNDIHGTPSIFKNAPGYRGVPAEASVEQQKRFTIRCISRLYGKAEAALFVRLIYEVPGTPVKGKRPVYCCNCRQARCITISFIGAKVVPEEGLLVPSGNLVVSNGTKQYCRYCRWLCPSCSRLGIVRWPYSRCNAIYPRDFS